MSGHQFLSNNEARIYYYKNDLTRWTLAIRSGNYLNQLLELAFNVPVSLGQQCIDLIMIKLSDIT
jgi:hypothetical protein